MLFLYFDDVVAYVVVKCQGTISWFTVLVSMSFGSCIGLMAFSNVMVYVMV